jgi:hypothetical protein
MINYDIRAFQDAIKNFTYMVKTYRETQTYENMRNATTLEKQTHVVEYFLYTAFSKLKTLINTANRAGNKLDEQIDIHNQIKNEFNILLACIDCRVVVTAVKHTPFSLLQTITIPQLEVHTQFIKRFKQEHKPFLRALDNFKRDLSREAPEVIAKQKKTKNGKFGKI